MKKRVLPAEGLEPTRSCDHWILSPARLPIPPRRRLGTGAKGYEIHVQAQHPPAGECAVLSAFCLHGKTQSRSGQRTLQQIEPSQTARWPENFAKNNCVAQTGSPCKHTGNVCS